MQTEGDDLNPYAAPQSDVTPLVELEPPMPRPASTKWLLGLMWIFAIAMACMLFRGYQKEGLSRYNTFRVALGCSWMVFTLIAFHFSKRSRITYALGILYLLFLICALWSPMSESVQKIAAAWNHPTSRTESWDILIVPPLLIATLCGTLCRRFIFGQASRRFYRVTQK
jgi:hypothetical protein